MTLLRTIAAIATALATATALRAQSSGTYQMEGGSYTITVEVGENQLIVVEPNKRSVYQRVGTTREYRFFNANTGSTFALTVVDDRTLQASRVPQTIAPNILRLVGASTAAAAQSQSDRFRAIADRYRLLAEGDTDNTQMWTFCAAAALGWATKPEAEAATYAWRAAQQVKPIAVDPARSPCRDAIPQPLWESATAPAAGGALARAPELSGPTPRSAGLGAAAPAPAAPRAVRNESPAAAAARDRAERATETAVAANAVVRAQDAQFEALLSQTTGIQTGATATDAVANGVAGAGAGVSNLSALIPTPDQWLNVWKDFRARRAAIEAQNAYVAQVRRDRLASGQPDVQGFTRPLRPRPTDILDPNQSARVTSIGLAPEFDPDLRAERLRYLQAMIPVTKDSSFFVGEGDGLASLADSLPGFSARLVSHAVRLVFTIESTEGRLRPYQVISCAVYGPSGRRLGQGNTLSGGSRRRQAERQERELMIIARNWTPGTYGVECGPFDFVRITPWLNFTFDVTP